MTDTAIRLLLERSIPGAKSTLRGHIARASIIADAIQTRFHCTTPHQWQAKHLRWYLENRLLTDDGVPFAQATQYDHWRTCRVLASVLGKWPAWEFHLRGNWCSHARKNQGGRPAKLPNCYAPPSVAPHPSR